MKIMEASARRNNCMSSILMSLGRHRCFIIHSACILHRLVRSRMQLNWKNTRWYNAVASCTHIILFYTRRSSFVSHAMRMGSRSLWVLGGYPFGSLMRGFRKVAGPAARMHSAALRRLPMATMKTPSARNTTWEVVNGMGWVVGFTQVIRWPWGGLGCEGVVAS